MNVTKVYKTTDLYRLSSEPAPDEWKEIPEIKKAKPKGLGFEISLQKITNLNICYWMICRGCVWNPDSPMFYIENNYKPKINR